MDFKIESSKGGRQPCHQANPTQETQTSDLANNQEGARRRQPKIRVLRKKLNRSVRSNRIGIECRWEFTMEKWCFISHQNTNLENHYFTSAQGTRASCSGTNP
jgi:hypothetical protein